MSHATNGKQVMSSNDTPKRVAIYCRISRAEQDDTGELSTDNVESQQRICEAFAKEKGWTVSEVYVDNSISGGKANRPAFVQLQLAMEDGKIDVALATELERFRRDEITDLQFRTTAKKHNVEIWTARNKSQLKQDTADERLMANMFASLATFEREKTSERQKAKKRDKSIQGEPLAGRYRPFGYKDKHMQELHPIEAKWVKSTFEKWNSGTNLYALSNMLNDNGLRKDSGRRFAIRDVRYMLKNEKYCGWVMRNGEVLTKEGKWTPIIDGQTFEIAQSRLQKNTKPLPKGNKPKRLLSAKLVCMNELDGDLCLQSMTINDSLYRCTPGHYGCGKNSINIFKIEDYVINMMLKRLMENLPETVETQVDHSADIASIDDKLERIAFLFREGDLTTEKYINQRNELREQKSQYISASASPVPAVGSFEKFCQSDLATQREVLNALIPEKIGIKPNITGKHKLDPNRIVLS